MVNNRRGRNRNQYKHTVYVERFTTDGKPIVHWNEPDDFRSTQRYFTEVLSFDFLNRTQPQTIKLFAIVNDDDGSVASVKQNPQDLSGDSATTTVHTTTVVSTANSKYTGSDLFLKVGQRFPNEELATVKQIALAEVQISKAQNYANFSRQKMIAAARRYVSSVDSLLSLADSVNVNDESVHYDKEFYNRCKAFLVIFSPSSGEEEAKVEYEYDHDE